MLQLQVRALCKYKSNYELLCGQLGEADVAALQTSIADLQTEKLALETQVSEAQQALTVQRDAVEQDGEYSEHAHRQLSTAAELLKATEKRLEQQEEQFKDETERMRDQLAVGEDDRTEYQATVKGLEEELAALRDHETETKELEALRRRREKSKHKKEIMAYAAKFRGVRDELEAQRLALRTSKKHLAQIQADNDALRKQLATVKRDGAHLSDIIDSQRVEQESYVGDLSQGRKAKKQLAKRMAVLSQEKEQLQNELADAKEDLVDRNSELKICRREQKSLRIELRQTTKVLDEVQNSSDKLLRQVEALQKSEKEPCTNAKMKDQGQRASRERQYRTELLRMRELLVANQQRATNHRKTSRSCGANS